jgi:hypothetical protein
MEYTEITHVDTCADTSYVFIIILLKGISNMESVEAKKPIKATKKTI